MDLLTELEAIIAPVRAKPACDCPLELFDMAEKLLDDATIERLTAASFVYPHLTLAQQRLADRHPHLQYAANDTYVRLRSGDATRDELLRCLGRKKKEKRAEAVRERASEAAA